MKSIFALVLLASMLIPAQAAAFVQTLTCNESGTFACRSGEVAKPVRWPTRCVHYYINEDGTEDIADNARTTAGIQQAFTTWGEVAGGEFVMEYAGKTNEDRAEHEGGRGDGNANVVIWRDDNWPYASRTAFAITSVTFDPVTGLIADADVEFNSESHRFTAGDGNVIVDVSNTLTHEAGHFLGLDHTTIADATMFGSAPEGETQKRTLHADDIEGLFAIYPALGVSTDCPDVPDFFEKPGDKSEKDGCCATAARPLATPWLLLITLIALSLGRQRRREA